MYACVYMLTGLYIILFIFATFIIVYIWYYS